MSEKPTYEQLEKRIQELEQKAAKVEDTEEAQRFIEIRHSLIEYAANHTLEELLTWALDEVGALVDSPIGFYHFVEPDQKTLSLQQWSTRTLKEFCRAKGKGMHYSIDQAGVWVDCVYAKKPVVHNDYASISHKKGMPEGHAKVIRELVVPVMRKDKVVAILGVGNKPTEYIQKDVEIVSYLADVTWEIVRQKRSEEEKIKALEFAAKQSKDALIGQVAGKMAHDFNNILMGIMGNAQLAIMDCDDEKTKVRMERINEYSERGKDITSNLVSFSKDQEPKQTYFRIEDKIELVLKMLQKDLADIKVSRNYKPGIPTLLADPGMIQDVLTNIIQNSIHAMGKVENSILNLKTYSIDNKIFLEIEDNGCGIPKEHQDSIYTPSFTLKGSYDKTGSYKSGIKGTGYGMSNVKRYIIEKHKGEISLESDIGKGTTITIALKVIKDHLSSDEKNDVVKRQIYNKRRILLVEDEPAIADVHYQILTKEPFYHIVDIAVNGQTAIDIFDRNKFDIISLDYMLPGNSNGLDVYHHIRENNTDIPVMFISGNIEFLESISELKANDMKLEHISKPVDNLDYVNKVNELIGKSSGRSHS